MNNSPIPKRSYDMKKHCLYPHLLICLLASVALTACTLYMDEPEDTSTYLRTDQGYMGEETVALADGTGTVSYTYNQKTIPINDEVEEYIVKVESDTIVYFAGSMPEDILPDVGSIMTCSFRPNFPHAFCHKCIERTEENGIYRCVFTKCSYDEAFDYLAVEVEDADLYTTDPSKAMSDEEFDEIMNGSGSADTDNEDDDEEEAASRVFDTPWRKSKGVTRANVGDGKEHKFKQINDTIFKVNLTGLGWTPDPVYDIIDTELGVGGYLAGNGRCSFTCYTTVKGSYSMSFDTKTGKMKTTVKTSGFLTFELDVTATGAVTFKSPVHVTPLGFQFDLIVVGMELGFTLQPYVTVKQTLKGRVALVFNTSNNGFTYIQESKNKLGTFTPIKGSTSSSKLEFGCTDPKESKKLEIEAGIDFRFGVSADVLGTGATVAIGIKRFASCCIPLDTKKYMSAEKFKAANGNFDTYTKAYVTGCLTLAGIGPNKTFESEPEKFSGKQIPLFPVVDKWTLKSTSLTENTFSTKFSLKSRGILTNFLNFRPEVRFYSIYDPDDEDGSIMEGSYPLKLHADVNGFANYWDASFKDKNITYNYPYIAQVGYNVYSDLTMTKPEFWIPIEDREFTVTVPTARIQSVGMVRSISYANSDGKETRAKNGVYYKYLYIIHVKLLVDGQSKAPKWGLRVYNNQGVYMKDFTHTNSANKITDQPTVRVYWYSNSPSVDLNFVPLVFPTKDGKNPSSSAIYGDIHNETISYFAPLDKSTSMFPLYENADYDMKAPRKPVGQLPEAGDEDVPDYAECELMDSY